MDDPADTPNHPDDPTVDDVVAVRQANRDFYAAFEEQDFDAMSDLWWHDDEASCTHPGWETLHGWAAISGSWVGLFETDLPLQIIVTNERVHVEGDVAWVTLDENVLDHDIAYMAGNTIAAVNIFRRIDNYWRMVVHHGSSIVEVTPVNWQEL